MLRSVPRLLVTTVMTMQTMLVRVPRTVRPTSAARIAYSPHISHRVIPHNLYHGHMPHPETIMLHGACFAWASHDASWACVTGPEAAGMNAYSATRMPHAAPLPMLSCLHGQLPPGAYFSMTMQPCLACRDSWHISGRSHSVMACSAASAHMCTHTPPHARGNMPCLWPHASPRDASASASASAHTCTPYRFRPRPVLPASAENLIVLKSDYPA